MKSLFKVAGYTILAFVFSIAFSGCINSNQATNANNKVVIWSFESEDNWKPFINQFQKENKSLEISYSQQTLDSDFEGRLLNSVLSGSGPDIFAMPNEWIYRHKEKLAPMPDTLKENMNLDKYVRSVGQSVSFDNKIYALSPTSEPLMIYYNPKLISNLEDEYSNYGFSGSTQYSQEERKKVTGLTNTMPKLWSDWVELAKYLTKKDSDGNITQSGAAIGTENVLSSQDILYLLMMQNDTQIISDNLKLATFNQPATTPPNESDYPGRKAIEFYTSFADPTSNNYIWNDTIGDSLDAFVNGEVAMIFGYSNLSNYFTQKYPEFKYSKSFVPQQSQDAEKIVDFARFNAFGVSKLSQNYEACWNMIDTLVVNLGQDFASSNNLYTSVKSNNDTVSILDRESSSPEKISLYTANSLVRGKYPREFDQFIKGAITSVLTKRQSSGVALDTAAEQITIYLNKATW